MTQYCLLSPGAQGLCGLIGLAVTAAALFSLIQILSLKIGGFRLALSSAVTAVSLVWLQGLADAGIQFSVGRELKGLGKIAGSFPAFAVFLVFFAVVLAEIFLIAGLVSARRRMLTADSVKESFDALLDGVCFSAPDGTPLLINEKMNELSLKLFGETVMNCESFWDRLCSGEFSGGNGPVQSELGPMIHLSDGGTVYFRRSALTVGRGEVTEIIGCDVTEQFKLSSELIKRNVALVNINRYLKRSGNEAEELRNEKEVLAAKIRVHDAVGRALITFRRYLALPVSERSRDELIGVWKENINVLKNLAETAPPADPMKQLRAAADAVDVQIKMSGELPEDERRRDILVSAMHECLTNMVRHAGGSELDIEISNLPGRVNLQVTNNGKIPEGEIWEGGGLGNLRRSVEMAGGEMKISSWPYFALSVSLPEEGERYA